MKALVLAGGMGIRLRPFSHTMAKQLVPVANKPVLFYGLEAIRDAGITQVAIIVGEHETGIRAAVGSGSRFGLEVSYIVQDRPRGLAHCVLVARRFLGDDDFVLYLGDNILQDGITGLVDAFWATRPDAMVLLGKVSDPSEYGTAVVDDDGRVLRLEEKSPNALSDLAVTGAYVFSPAIHQAVRAITPSWRDELEITDAMQWLIEHGHVVRSELCHGYWKDTGKIDDWLDCNRVLMERLEPDVRGSVDAASTVRGAVVVDETAEVVRSELTGPLVVGPGAAVRDSRLGPYTAVGEDCVVQGSTVEDSLLLTGATVDGVRGLSGSLIGRYARVGRADARPRLVIGEHSRVLLRG